MALRTRPTPTLSQPCPPVRAPSLSRRRPPPPSSVSFVHGNQPKPCGSLKSPAPDGLLRLPCKPLLKDKLRRPEFGARKQSSASSSPVCLLAPKDKPGRAGNQGLPWESFGDATDSFKGKSIEEMLREQMRNLESNGGGGSGKKKPPGGGGGGGRGRGGGSGGRERDEASSFGVTDEALQVILATIGFLFVYFYVINGVEMIHLAKDYIKFLWTGSKSVRLKKAMVKWGSFLQPLLDKKELYKCWLERKLVDATRTWFDVPTKYRRMLRSYLTSNTDH